MNKKIYQKDDFWVETLELKNDSFFKTIIIIPPTGGTNILDRKYAKYFHKNNFNVVILDHWKDENEYNIDLEIHNRFYDRGNKSIRMVLETIDHDDIYLLGTSVGGIHSVVASVSFPKIKKIFSIVGGISISDIVVKSDQEILVKGKKERQKIFNFKDDNDYVQQLFKVNSFEPEKHQFIKTIKTGQIIALKDSTVPLYTQEKLKEFWNTDKVIYLKNNHYWAIVKSYVFYKKQILNFFLN